MFACFVGFGVVGTQEAYWGEVCRRGARTECQARGQKGKILDKKVCYTQLHCSGATAALRVHWLKEWKSGRI